MSKNDKIEKDDAGSKITEETLSMPTPKEPVNCLGKFIDRISENRQSWGLPKHKELSFRGESKKYGDTILRPELYRPPNVGVPLKPISELLNLNWTVNSPSGSTTL